MAEMIRVGAVSYLNAKPLYYRLDEFAPGVDLEMDVPSRLADRLAAVAPRPLRFVDGARGIARRTAYLTRDQRWPESPAPGLAVFTAPIDLPEGLRTSLARFGLEEIGQL